MNLHDRSSRYFWTYSVKETLLPSGIIEKSPYICISRPRDGFLKNTEILLRTPLNKYLGGKSRLIFDQCEMEFIADLISFEFCEDESLDVLAYYRWTRAFSPEPGTIPSKGPSPICSRWEPPCLGFVLLQGEQVKAIAVDNAHDDNIYRFVLLDACLFKMRNGCKRILNPLTKIELPRTNFIPTKHIRT